MAAPMSGMAARHYRADDQVILGADAATYYKVKLGDTLPMMGKNFTVAGVMASSGNIVIERHGHDVVASGPGRVQPPGSYDGVGVAGEWRF